MDRLRLMAICAKFVEQAADNILVLRKRRAELAAIEASEEEHKINPARVRARPPHRCSSSKCFFVSNALPSDADPVYQVLRDFPPEYGGGLHDRLDQVWQDFMGICGDDLEQFRREAVEHPVQQLWVMYLARELRLAGIVLERGSTGGPDLRFGHEGQQYWVECVVPARRP